MLHNYTIQDIFSLLLAVPLFATVLVFPGYVIGWCTNLFSFKQRTLPAQYVIALALSNAVMPVILFLAFRFVSNQFGIGIVIAFFILWVVIQLSLVTKHPPKLESTPELKLALVVAGIWIGFCIFLLVDIQVGQRLYNNAASYDFGSRTALIEAITRTGIPPVNPNYYPGHFVRITELYYFWYILGSVVDTLGGKWVDARITLFAGITWGGLSVMATIATYLRIRNPQSGLNARRAAILGAQLLTVSGLDFIPVIAIMIAVKTIFGNLPFDGRIEGWNLPVMSWLNALTWVPNHVTGMVACIIAMLLILSSERATKSHWAINVAVAGASLASAFGLSIWVPFTFGIFMGVWAVSLLFQKNHRRLLLAIIVAGILGLLAASPFLMEILRSGGKSEATGAFPVALYVRHFSFFKALPHGLREIVNTLLLPVNYFFELGFFFMIAALWIRQTRKTENWQNNSFWKAETFLLVTVAVLLSFVKSTVLVINDLGMRAWLLGQFILIVWAVDILMNSSKGHSWLSLSSIRALPAPRKISDLLGILMIVGMLTTVLESFSTRFWTILIDTGIAGVPNELTPDAHLGERIYDGRLAYEFIRDHTPPSLVVQNNPVVVLDRPSGLYGTRQMVISDKTIYGVPTEVYWDMSASIGHIFLAKAVTDWSSVDKLCSQYFIQAIIVNDTDPLWLSLETLQEQRAPLYHNKRYAVFSCGSEN